MSFSPEALPATSYLDAAHALSSAAQPSHTARVSADVLAYLDPFKRLQQEPNPECPSTSIPYHPKNKTNLRDLAFITSGLGNRSYPEQLDYLQNLYPQYGPDNQGNYPPIPEGFGICITPVTKANNLPINQHPITPPIPTNIETFPTTAEGYIPQTLRELSVQQASSYSCEWEELLILYLFANPHLSPDEQIDGIVRAPDSIIRCNKNVSSELSPSPPVLNQEPNPIQQFLDNLQAKLDAFQAQYQELQERINSSTQSTIQATKDRLVCGLFSCFLIGAASLLGIRKYLSTNP